MPKWREQESKEKLKNLFPSQSTQCDEFRAFLYEHSVQIWFWGCVLPAFVGLLRQTAVRKTEHEGKSMAKKKNQPFFPSRLNLRNVEFCHYKLISVPNEMPTVGGAA